jgi:hypothetical protein
MATRRPPSTSSVSTGLTAEERFRQGRSGLGPGLLHGRRRRLGRRGIDRQLQNGRCLPLAQMRQEDLGAIRELQRIVMAVRLVLVDMAEAGDRRAELVRAAVKLDLCPDDA